MGSPHRTVAKRRQARLNLARFLAKDMAPEAKAVLDVALWGPAPDRSRCVNA